MEKLHIKLNGLTPLLMHNPVGSMTQPRGRGIERKVIPTPEEETKASRYLLPDGNMGVPASAILGSLLQGARGYRIGRRSATEVLAGAIVGKDGYFPLLRDGKPIAGDDYTIDSRRAVIKRQGIIRNRAKIELPWQVEADFEFNSEIANIEQVKTALSNAGLTVGILDGRSKVKGSPSAGLWFGKFEVSDIWTE